MFKRFDWGERQLEELEAEERVAFACEKGGATKDAAIEKVDCFVHRYSYPFIYLFGLCCSINLIRGREAAGGAGSQEAGGACMREGAHQNAAILQLRCAFLQLSIYIQDFSQ